MAFSFVFEVTDVAALPTSPGALWLPGRHPILQQTPPFKQRPFAPSPVQARAGRPALNARTGTGRFKFPSLPVNSATSSGRTLRPTSSTFGPGIFLESRRNPR